MPTFDKRPIGVFDSGLGGLTVVRALARVMPEEDLVYLGDTARVPYGNKSRETVVRFSTENVLFLLRQGVKMIVVACHTASSYALPFLERHFKLPILGVIEPGVETAIRWTQTGRVGVIGTQATVSSGAYLRTFKRMAPKIKVVQVACPLFVPLVEEGWCTGPLVDQVAERYLKPLKRARIDTLILGCTHYPLLKQTVGRVLGSHVRLVDSAQQVAIKAKELLITQGLARPNGLPTACFNGRFFVTDEPHHFEKMAKRFLGWCPRPILKADVSTT